MQVWPTLASINHFLVEYAEYLHQWSPNHGTAAHQQVLPRVKLTVPQQPDIFTPDLPQILLWPAVSACKSRGGGRACWGDWMWEWPASAMFGGVKEWCCFSELLMPHGTGIYFWRYESVPQAVVWSTPMHVISSLYFMSDSIYCCFCVFLSVSIC